MKKNIYLIAPSNFFTGGPLSIHQLAFFLKKLGNNVKILYTPKINKNPVHKEFKNYKLDYCFDLVDKKKNILIIPEHFSALNLSLKFKNVKKVIWWLSVDNYLNSKFRAENSKLTRAIIKIPYFLIYLFNKLTFFYFGIFTLKDYLKIYYNFFNFNEFKELKQSNLHINQSYYALDFLKKKLNSRNKMFLVEDHQKDDFINLNKDFKKIKKFKKNIISYNATKSNEFMKLILIYNKDFTFIPIKKLKPEEVRKVLMQSKIYIDYGYHPGKDRAPREAAMLGNCIICNKKGSAKNDFDINIPDAFKIPEKFNNLKKIRKVILSVFNNYEKESIKFSKYRFKIINEKQTISKQLKKLTFL